MMNNPYKYFGKSSSKLLSQFIKMSMHSKYMRNYNQNIIPDLNKNYSDKISDTKPIRKKTHEKQNMNMDLETTNAPNEVFSNKNYPIITTVKLKFILKFRYQVK